MDRGWILLGRVSKPHGLGGEVKVFPYSGDPHGLARSYQVLYLARDREDHPQPFRVRRARVQGRQALILLEGIANRTAAEQIAGFSVYVRAEELPPLDEDEFYLHELENRDLVDPEGTVLGRIKRIIETGGHDVLVVRQGKKEFLVPAVGDFIKAIEPDRVIMDLPPGLLEING